jgi:hypothetical protein
MQKLLFVIATAAVVGFASAASADKLSQADAQKALDGHTFSTHDFGEDGTLTWSGDTLTAKLQTKSDTAKVRWAEGGYCSAWTKFRSTEACFTVEKLSDTQYQLWTSDGKKDDLLTLVK